MEPTEILKGIVAIVTVFGVVLGGLAVGAAVRHRKEIWLVEKREALRKSNLYEQKKAAVEKQNSNLVGASHG